MSSLMALGTRAMFAAYAQLNTVSHNIANANTPGYSRQQTVQTTAEGQFTGSGFMGRGVTVQTVTRASNMFLTQQVQAARAEASATGVRRDMLQQLEQVFGSGAQGLGNATVQLLGAFSDLAAAPSDLSARQAVLARAEDLASMARSYSSQLDMVQANVRTDIENAASEVNTLASQVAMLNSRIANALATGHSPNDLLDQRDQLIGEISQHIEVHTIGASDGSTSVFIAGGQSLVLGQTANKLVVSDDDYDITRAALKVSVAGQETPLNSTALGSGALAGLLAFQNEDLVDTRNRLGQLAASLAVTMNTQQSFGIDLSGSSGAPLFTYTAPEALPASTNAKAAGSFIASVGLAITDPTALKASEYEMKADPANAGKYLITRRSDGQTFSNVASGDVVDGFSITVSPPLPAANDRFLLRPSSMAASGLGLALQNPRAIAAGSPVTAVAATTNTGTASVSSLNVVAAPTVPYASLSLNFVNATGGYQLVATGPTVVASGTWSAGTPITYNGLELRLTGQPANGDSYTLAPTAYPTASNGNALAFDALASRQLVDGQTLTDAYAQLLSEVGVRVQGAETAADTAGAVSARASKALEAETGVNLDEEAAKLIQYQQSYQAAAKLLQTAQTVMDTLLQLGR